MKLSYSKVANQFASAVCALALLVAPLTDQFCRSLFYQPTEPEGFKEFCANRKKK